MYLSNESLLVILLVGLVAGFLAGKIVRGAGFGLIGDLLVGIVGAFIGEDPIAAGFATSLSHPGGTVTGIVMLAPELDAARLLLLHELVPASRKIAALAVNSTRDAPNLAAISEVAERVGVSVPCVYLWETDQTRQREKNLSALCKVLKATVSISSSMMPSTLDILSSRKVR